MKKNIIFVAAVLASVVACNKEIEVSSGAEGQVDMSFAVSTEQTKTVLEGSNKTLWQGVEKLSIFDGESNNLFAAELASPSASAQFSGKAKTAGTYYALYPYSSTAKLSGTEVSTELPAAQTATKGSFDPSAALLFGVSDGTSISLRNLTAMLKFTVPANVTSIEVEGNGTALAGNVKVNVESASLSGATSSKVVLSGKGALVAGTYYIAVAPATVSGLSVKLIDSANSKYILRSVADARTFDANTIYDMGTFAESEWVSDSAEQPSGNELVIFDGEFKDGFSIENNTMSIETVDGQNCLKWEFKSAAAWANYGVIKIDPALDFANFDAENTYLKFKFKVGVDNGPADVHTLFRAYFGLPGVYDEFVGGVGHNGAPLGNYEAVVNDNEWHELSLSLKDHVAAMSGDKAVTVLGFTPRDVVAAVGTTIYFKDIRIEGKKGGSSQPTEDAQIIFNGSMQNGWVLGGTDGKYSIAAGAGKNGGNGIEWLLDNTNWWSPYISFDLPINMDISKYTKLCLDIEYLNSAFKTDGGPAFTNRVYGDGVEMYFNVSLPNNSGWNTLEMPLNDFTVQSGTKDWTKIKTFVFHANGWNAGTATVHIDNVRLVK